MIRFIRIFVKTYNILNRQWNFPQQQSSFCFKLRSSPCFTFMQETVKMSAANYTEDYFNNKTTEMPEPPSYILVVSSIMYILTFILGIFGNVNVIFIIYKFKTMRSRMNFFLVNLSVADFFILLVCIPSAAVDLFAKEVWYFGEAMCEYNINYYMM